MTTQVATAPAVSDHTVSAFLAKVYLIMSLGLLVTGLVAAWTVTNSTLMGALLTRPFFGFGLFILQIILVVFLSARVIRMSPGAAAVAFLFYAALTGVTISTIFLVYTREQIATVFFFTAATFLVMSLFGLLTKRDMTTAGTFLIMLLFGWILVWFVSWIFPLSGLNWAMNYVGIAIFVGLTAYDTQRLKRLAQTAGDKVKGTGLAVLGALNLYLDYINLFLLLLRVSNR
jgi:FtsH-binding integral membrane protein